ncbi:FecR family protein [Mucilaginibacter gilvus]|uniref:FecR family protein n=1 Tax=Mucilaginibacter gilvus TaxID=2305909 RepID=A0A444MR07_9SPHI|nr:FecR family protein [Mucilaginibacter gilvus]RWY54058.1 FecR family protein [Mucilaginibacter gilvus]
MDIYKLRKILQRYREGKANETESALVEAWYKSYEQQERFVGREDAEKIRRAISRGVKAATLKHSVIQLPILRVAASFAIFLTICFFGWRLRKGPVSKTQTYTTVTTGTKGLRELVLSDGSLIRLNAASRLKIPNVFSGQLREVVLEEGEAFFQIKRDPERPFIVHTSPLNVQVLGTSFNIRAYKNLHAISVTVTTGKVGVTGKSKTLAMLMPGQQLNYNIINGAIQQLTVDLNHAQSWQKGFTYLDQAGFNELSTIVKNIYGLSIKAGNKKVGGYRFTLRLMHNLPASQVLGLISQLHHTHFRKEGNDIILY